MELMVNFSTWGTWGTRGTARIRTWTLALYNINDLEYGIKSHIKLVDHDTSLFSIVEDPNTSTFELNHGLNLMAFNPDPTKQAVQIAISRKSKQKDYSIIYFNNIASAYCQ